MDVTSFKNDASLWGVDGLDRLTLGIQKSSTLYEAVKWRLSDLILLGLFTVISFIAYSLKPFERQFFINDLTISHPFAEVERVNNKQLFLFATVIPGVVIFVLGSVLTHRRYRIYVTYVSLLGLGLSLLSTSVLTDILKNFFGRHRPDFLARCVPNKDAPRDVMVLAKDVCTTSNKDRLLDGFRTTPSGHSSTSFAGLFYLSLWLAGQTMAVDALTGAVRAVFSLLPTLGATLIALSRTEDYRHHFIDVFVGSIIGLTIASWSYFRIFPSIAHSKCFSPRLLNSEVEDFANSSQYRRIDLEDV